MAAARSDRPGTRRKGASSIVVAPRARGQHEPGAPPDVHVVELATHLRPARNLDDLVAVEPVVAGIAVSLQEAPERPKMVLGALTLTIGRVAEQHRRWAAIAGRAVVPSASPWPALRTSGCSRALALSIQS